MDKKIKLGIVGLGQRGQGMLHTFLLYSVVDVVAVCDVYEDRMQEASDYIFDKRNSRPAQYKNFKDMLKDKNIDAMYIASSWEEHINQAIDCLYAKIPCGMEVGGAYSINDCWRIVNAYEKTKTPIMMMENCCYDKFETISTLVARAGKFGEIVHCNGAYSHDLREEITGGNINRHYRLRNYIARNCENYPTHELGPIAKILKINAGNRFVSMVSVASKARGLEEFANSDKCKDKSLKGTKFAQGDVVTTIITCENGETITMKLDTTLPGYYSRDFVIKGTQGMAKQESNMLRFDDDAEHQEIWDTFTNLATNGNNLEKYKQYWPKFWRDITPEQIETGHGGMDFFMIGKFLECLI